MRSNEKQEVKNMKQTLVLPLATLFLLSFMYFIVKDEDLSFQEEKREFSNVLRHSRRLQLTLPETPSLLNHYPYSMLRRFDEALDESDVPFFW